MNLINKSIGYALPYFPKPIVGYFAKPYIAGERLDDAVRIIKKLMSHGTSVTLDVLGEEITHKDQALHAVEIYKQALQRISSEKLDSDISVKPTHMGLKLDREFCYQNFRTVLETARIHHNFVTIDMEDHTTTSDTLELFTQLRQEFDNVGTVLQAYLRRTISDINKLIPLRPHLRICKGIYLEPHAIAYHDDHIINQNFAYALEKLILNNCYVCIATHDEQVVWEAMRIIDKYQVSKERYEFQMLLGVEQHLRRIIIRSGHRMRVYVPFGTEWFAYSTRRLKENPHIIGYVTKSLLGRVLNKQ